MREAACSTLEALERVAPRGREDRLTEMFAYVLSAVPELVAALISAAPMAAPMVAGGGAEVLTQGELAGEGRPDLQIYYKDRAGKTRLVLSEHKIGAGLTDYQRSGYPGWPDREALLLIAPDVARYREEAKAFDVHLTWLQVAEWVDAIGCAQCGQRWRLQALKPTTTAALRGLHEFLLLLESYVLGGDGVKALDDDVLRSYSSFDEARRGLKHFLTLVARDQRLSAMGAGDLTPYLNDTVWSVGLDLEWPLLRAIAPYCGAEIVIAPSVAWLPEVEGPMLYAGFYFGITDRRLPEIFRDDPRIALELEHVDAVVAAQNATQAKCLKVLRLTEVVQEHSELSEQKTFVANWIVSSFGDLLNIAPSNE